MNDDQGQEETLTRVTRIEPEDLNNLTETGPFVELTSEDAPGSAENGVMQPLPMALGNPHRSGKIPDHGTPRFGDLHHFHDERFLIPCSIGSPTFEFERCRQMLKRAIKDCLKLEFAYVVSAISCILNSLRPLHTLEVDKATKLFVEYADNKHLSFDKDGVARKRWFDRCEPLLVVDKAGQVRFASEYMPPFLKQFRIRGIDATHQTIATACLIQIDMDEKCEDHPLAASMPCLPTHSDRVFSGYANRHWREHCQNAEESCQDLSAMASEQPTLDRSAILRGGIRGAVANADADLDKIGLDHLTLDEQEWEVVDDTG